MFALPRIHARTCMIFIIPYFKGEQPRKKELYEVVRIYPKLKIDSVLKNKFSQKRIKSHPDFKPRN